MLKAKSRITALAAAAVHGSVIAIALVAIAMSTTRATVARALCTAARATLKTRSRGIDKAIDCNRACSTEENNTARRADRIPGMAREYAI